LFAPDTMLSQDAYTQYPSDVYFASYSLAFPLSKKWDFDFSTSGSLNDFDNTTDNRSTIKKVSALQRLVENITRVGNDGSSLNFRSSATGTLKIDSTGSEWVNDLFYNFSQNKSDQVFLTNNYFPVDSVFGGDGNNDNKRHHFHVQSDLKLKMKTFPLAKLAGRYKTFFSLYLKYAKLGLKKIRIKGIEEFNNPLQKNYARIFRDRNYLNYKKRNDKFFIKLNGIVLWIRLTDVFWIGDFDNYELLSKDFLRRIKKMAFWLGYNTISFNLNKTIPLPSIFDSFHANCEEPSCFYYFDKSLEGINMVVTAADFDTW